MNQKIVDAMFVIHADIRTREEAAIALHQIYQIAMDIRAFGLTASTGDARDTAEVDALAAIVTKMIDRFDDAVYPAA